MAELAEERKAADKGKEARLIRAAKMYAVARGLGYRGAHLGGHNMSYEDVKFITSRGEEYYKRWPELVAEFVYPQPGGFYYFQKDAKTGLNTIEPSPLTGEARKSTVYNFSRLVHNSLLEPNHPFFRMYQRPGRAH